MTTNTTTNITTKMTTKVHQRTNRSSKREDGLVLLMTMFILMFIGVIAVDAIGQSETESTAAGRSRSTIRTMHAADAGIQLAISRLTQSPPNLDPIDETFADRIIQSRARSVTSGAEGLAFAGVGKAPEGYSVNLGESYVTEAYEVIITATSLDGSIAEVESKITRLDAGEAY